MGNSQFKSLWRLAAALCVILTLFTLLFVSCTRAPKGDAVPAQAAPPAAATDQPQTLAPSAEILTPEPTPPDAPADNAPPDADQSLPDGDADSAED